MNKNNFYNALQNAQLTTEALNEAFKNLRKRLDECTPETVGEVLNDAVAISGLSQLLLIDIHELIKA